MGRQTTYCDLAETMPGRCDAMVSNVDANKPLIKEENARHVSRQALGKGLF